MTDININHVLSSDISSTIFDDLLFRITVSAPHDICIRVSKRPLPGQALYHFHRPHLELRLPRNAVTTVHHDLADTDHWHRFEKFQPRYRQAAVNICLNTGQQEFLATHGISNAVVIPHGYDPTVFDAVERPKHHDGARPVVIGIVSRRYPRRFKGEGQLYDLLKHLPKGRFSFLFVGRGRWQDMKVARAFGFDAACYDGLPYSLFGEIYRRIDLLLIMSLFEGGPACLPEALGSGTPVIATPVGMAVDMIRPGENGLILTGDGAADAARISGLLENGGRGLNVLFEGAAAGAGDTPTWDETIARLFDLYREIVSHKGCGVA